MTQNYAEAYAWYMALANGNWFLPVEQKEAMLQLRDALRQQMTQEQITAGEQRAKVLRAGFEGK